MAICSSSVFPLPPAPYLVFPPHSFVYGRFYILCVYPAGPGVPPAELGLRLLVLTFRRFPGALHPPISLTVLRLPSVDNTLLVAATYR